MKVIFVKNINGIGKIGDIKEVKDGFARNFLLPQKIVRQATDETIEEIAADNERKVKNKVKAVKKYHELAKKINNLKLIIQVKADDKKKLFGSVNGLAISEELKKRHYDIEPKFIKLEEPIKSLGYYDIDLDFGAGVTAKLGLTVTREE
jgi:large subunit ribosomal protein L9